MNALRKIVTKAVDFVQNEALAGMAAQKGFRIFHGPAHPGQFAVEILDVLQGSGQAGLAGTTDPPQPEDRAAGPLRFDPSDPIGTLYHTQLYLHLV